MAILTGSQRGGARNLALHLLKVENEHVDVHEIRGFVSGSVMGALNEAYAVSRATRCKKFLYSLSVNPPPNQLVSTDDFIGFINDSEDRLGLSGQPRVIVFHEKQGRRHAHCVWSRIKTDELKAVQISFDHKTLVQLSREIFMSRGWGMPEGLIDPRNHDPRNFTLAEWQQAKRIGKDPREITAVLREAWAISDDKISLIHALQERGFKLARGDKGRFVVIDHHLEVYSLPRSIKQKTKDVRARIGAENDLPNLKTQKAKIQLEMDEMLGCLQKYVLRRTETAGVRFETRREALVKKQQAERSALERAQEQALKAANQERQSRFRSGIKGVWDRMRGEHRRIQKLNEREAVQQCERHQYDKDTLIQRHLKERQRIEIFKLRYNVTSRNITQNLELDQRVYINTLEP